MIELSDIVYDYGEGEVLSGISVSIAQGGSVAFIGPNGCGKSTLMKLLNGIVLPRSGGYLFDGAEVCARSLKDPAFAKRFHQRLGFLFQNSDAQLFCPVVHDEVAFGPRQMGLPESEVEKRVEDCLELLGIRELRSRVPYHLSGGEKRRVALAAVLALNPEVLVLDEPMSGLDPRMKSFLREIVASLNRAGKTIVCSTHDFAYVDGLFETAVVIGADHRVARVGPWLEIMADEKFLREQNII
ncbi:MAG: ABC transporter ATP-binding protein [Rectinemataceae bacterium]|jgi:cobalt/nickel transport system ATP-binding protein